jgi:hypothetical protein
MTAEPIRALESVGFDWGTSKNVLASIWSERFQQLREFNVQFGHCGSHNGTLPTPLRFNVIIVG